MASKVAIVELGKDASKSLRQAFELIGGIDDLNKRGRAVVVKPGIFDHRKKNHPTVDVVDSIIKSFNKAPKIFLAESDNYKGTGTERLRIYERALSRKVTPFNLSEDAETRKLKIAGEKMSLSHVLFKPNAFVSVHVLRKSEMGAILKNLFGLVPVREKVVYHKRLVSVLLDIYEAVGGIDLAVMDATYAYRSIATGAGSRAGYVFIGRDAVAVDAVGGAIFGFDSEKMPIVRGAMKRGLGEGDIDKIEVVRHSIEDVREGIKRAK